MTYKTLKKEIGGDANYTVLTRRINIVKMTVLPKTIYRSKYKKHFSQNTNKSF